MFPKEMTPRSHKLIEKFINIGIIENQYDIYYMLQDIATYLTDCDQFIISDENKLFNIRPEINYHPYGAYLSFNITKSIKQDNCISRSYPLIKFKFFKPKPNYFEDMEIVCVEDIEERFKDDNVKCYKFMGNAYNTSRQDSDIIELRKQILKLCGTTIEDLLKIFFCNFIQYNV